jgi:hypothetical protein
MAKNKELTPKQVEASRKNGKKGGRPKGSLSETARMQQEMRKMLTQRARKEFSGLIDAQLDLARGVYVEEVDTVKDKKGNIKTKRRVYKRPPSSEAIKYLMDQAVGKPKETRDVNLTDGRRVSIDELEMVAQGKIEEVIASIDSGDDEDGEDEGTEYDDE